MLTSIRAVCPSFRPSSPFDPTPKSKTTFLTRTVALVSSPSSSSPSPSARPPLYRSTLTGRAGCRPGPFPAGRKRSCLAVSAARAELPGPLRVLRTRPTDRLPASRLASGSCSAAQLDVAYRTEPSPLALSLGRSVGRSFGNSKLYRVDDGHKLCPKCSAAASASASLTRSPHALSLDRGGDAMPRHATTDRRTK